MLNFSVNGATYGVVFSSNAVILPHPRKGLQDSEMIIATMFDADGPIGSGWALRSQKDSPDPLKGMKESFGRAVLAAFADERDIEGVKFIDQSKARESLWKQFRMALAKHEALADAEDAAAEQNVEEVMTQLQDFINKASAPHAIMHPVVLVDPFDTPPSAVEFVTNSDPADEQDDDPIRF